MGEDKSRWKKFAEGVQETTSILSGIKTEDLVNHYTEQSTKAILGLHQDVETQNDKIKSFQENQQDNDARLKVLSTRLDQFQENHKSSTRLLKVSPLYGFKRIWIFEVLFEVVLNLPWRRSSILQAP